MLKTCSLFNPRRYYTPNGSAPCYFDPLAVGASYPSGCILAADGGGFNAANGRPSTLNVPRASILPLQAAVWCPRVMNLRRGATFLGGGPYGPQYSFALSHDSTYTGAFPYTEFIEVGVERPVYVFGINIGMARGAGAIVAIRARDPSAAAGSDGEWVRMYEAAALVEEGNRQMANGGAYWRWSPQLCRLTC